MSRRPPIAALLYGLLLAAMAGTQLASFEAFRDALRGYDLSLSGAAAVAVVSVEAFAAAGLLASAALPRRAARAGGVMGLVVAAFWSVLAAQAFARGLDLDNCGCFGAHLAQPLRWWVLLEDAYLLVLAVLAARSVGVSFPSPSIRLRRPIRPAHRTSEEAR
jgi:hypothetical protein